MHRACAGPVRKKINFFISYAHKSGRLADSLLSELQELMRPSRAYEYHLWHDSKIVIGENWRQQIFDARDNCDFGLLLISPAFLSSEFIVEHELSHFLGDGRAMSVPVLLSRVDFQLHDLHGLEHLQIFRYQGNRYREPRAFGECRNGQPRRDFVFTLYQTIEAKLSKNIVG